MKLRIKVDVQTFEVEVGDINERPIRVNVDGETFEVWPEEGQQPASVASAVKAGQVAVPVVPKAAAAPVQPAAASGERARAVLAPIPGVILTVSVRPGDEVSAGQELCVLEAMKMKNSIRANRAGKIASVKVTPGDQVRHSQVLLEYSD